MLLGGRTAEELIFPTRPPAPRTTSSGPPPSPGQMVTEYGMSDTLGPLRFGQPAARCSSGAIFANTPDYSDEVAASIDAEVRG